MIINQSQTMPSFQLIQYEYVGPFEALDKGLSFLFGHGHAIAQNMDGAGLAHVLNQFNFNHADMLVLGTAILGNILLVLKRRALN
jgi:hypothetical protein